MRDDAPIFDPDVLASLRDLDAGDPGFLAGVLEDYAAQVRGAIASIGRALGADDAARAAREAHSLKGASASVGATRLQALFAEIEMAGKAGDVATARDRLARVAECAPRLDAEAARAVAS